MNLRTGSKLFLAVDTYRALLERRREGQNVTGKLPADWDASELIQALEDLDLFVGGPDTEGRVEFHPPIASDKTPFYFSFSDIFKNKSRLIHTPSAFYLADDDFLYEGNRESAPSRVQLYLEAIEFADLLKECAHHSFQDTSGVWKIIFLGSKKIEISISYGEHFLVRLNKLNHLRTEYIQSTVHHDQKIAIVQKVLEEMFSTTNSIEFSDLLARYDNFLWRVDSAYKLYVSEFSFEKIRTAIEAEKLELTLKLNKVFSDIQNQLLAVPAALLLVGGQMDSAKTATLKNLLIWVGALIFGVLMDLLVRNQRNSLLAVNSEIENQWLKIESDHLAVANKFVGGYRDLRAREGHQRILLWTVDALVAFSIFVATGLLAWYSFTIDEAWLIAQNGFVLGGGIYAVTLFLLYLNRKRRERKYAQEDADRNQ